MGLLVDWGILLRVPYSRIISDWFLNKFESSDANRNLLIITLK